MICRKCLTRPGTQIWAPDGLMGWNHGLYQHWCEYCVTRAQLEFAEAQRDRIPELKKRLVELLED